MTLKVALFMQDFAGGGVETMRLALAAALTAAGCSVSIVVVNAAGPLATKIPPGVELHDLNCRSVIQALPKLRRYIRDEQPDILVSSLDHNNIAALLACITMRTHTRLIICQHNALSEEVRLGWKYGVVPFLYRMLAGRADAIIAVSNGVANDLAAITGLARKSITVIGNPVIRSGGVRALTAPIHPWMHDASTPVFIFVGRLVSQKNPMMLIAAFVHYVAARPARLIILGDGPLRGEMLRAAQASGVEHHIHFAGFVPEPKHWIAHAHALLLTSSYEGFANVIVEALACGTPVIATDCPYGPSEILSAGQYGHLVAVDDAAAFAVAMTDDLRTRFPAAMLCSRALDFTDERAAANHMALFRQWPVVPRQTAFGLTFSTKSAQRIADQLVGETPNRTKLVVTPNIDHVRLLMTTPAFRAACIDADTICADGWPVAFYAFLRGAAPRRRATGCDILHVLLSHELISTRRILAVVESCATAAALTKWLMARQWRNWAVEVAPGGLSLDPVAQMRLAATILSFQPQILIMTLGAPASETFVHAYLKMLPDCWAICVGQALRVEIGLTTRAPTTLRRSGLEWAWRVAHEPTRLGPRYMLALLWFPYAALTDLLQSTKPATNITAAARLLRSDRHKQLAKSE